MTLEDALLEILVMNNAETFTSSQVYSILSDLGVFKSNPKLKIVLKIALEYGLWNMIVAKADSYKVDILKTKLENDGFTDSIIAEILAPLRPARKKDSATVQVKPIESTNQIHQKIAVQSPLQFSFTVKRGIDCGIVPVNSKTNRIIYEQCSKLFIAPDWNQSTRIIVNELKFDTLNSISYKITCDPNVPTSYAKVHIALLIETVDGYLFSKNRILDMDVSEKYAMRTGNCTLNLQLPLAKVDKIIFLPEAGDFDLPYINQIYSISKKGDLVSNTFDKFKNLNCKIVLEPLPFSLLNLRFSNFRIWGNNTFIYLTFDAIGKNNDWRKGFFLGDNYLFAFFSDNDELVMTHKLFFGKQGTIGPRGGLHDTYMSCGNIQFVFMKYWELPIDSSRIKKIIITSGR